MRGRAEILWLFANNIDFDRLLAARVGARMADMGAIVHGQGMPCAQQIEDWDFEGKLFSEREQEIVNAFSP